MPSFWSLFPDAVRLDCGFSVSSAMPSVFILLVLQKASYGITKKSHWRVSDTRKWDSGTRQWDSDTHQQVFDIHSWVFDTRPRDSGTHPQVFDTHSRVFNTRPRVFNTHQWVFDTRPRIFDTCPWFFDTHSRAANMPFEASHLRNENQITPPFFCRGERPFALPPFFCRGERPFALRNSSVGANGRSPLPAIKFSIWLNP